MAVSIQEFEDRYNRENRATRIQQLMERDHITRQQAEERYTYEVGDAIEAAVVAGEVNPDL